MKPLDAYTIGGYRLRLLLQVTTEMVFVTSVFKENIYRTYKQINFPVILFSQLDLHTQAVRLHSNVAAY